VTEVHGLSRGGSVTIHSATVYFSSSCGSSEKMHRAYFRANSSIRISPIFLNPSFVNFGDGPYPEAAGSSFISWR